MLSPEASVQVRRYVEFLDEVAPPVTFDEIASRQVVSGVVESLPPRASWMRPARWVWAAAAALVVLMLVGGGIWLTGDRDDGSSVATESRRGETTAPKSAQSDRSEEPSDLSGDRGTVDTQLGPIPWVHATHVTLVPRQAIRTPSGFAGVTEEEAADGRVTSRWVTSSNGVTWAQAPFPVPLDPQAEVGVGEARGRFWLSGGSRLWLSDDTEAWTEVDLAEITPPPSGGVVWTLRLESPAVRDDLLVFPYRLHAELPVSEIFDPGSDIAGGIHRTNCGWRWELEECQDVADDIDVVFGVDLETGEETLLARFRLEAEGDSAYVVDIDTGDRVHEFSIAGLEGEQLTGISGSDIVQHALLLVGPEPTGSVVDVPWSRLGLASDFIAVFDDRFVAYVDNGSPQGPRTLDAIEVWESADARTWTSRGPVDFGIDTPGEVLEVGLFERHDGSAVAVVQSDGEEEPLPAETTLISTDGFDWVPVARDVPGAWVEQIGGGFVSFADGAFVSKDGERWEKLIAFDPPVGDSFVIVGDTLIAALWNAGTADLWAFDLEP